MQRLGEAGEAQFGGAVICLAEIAVEAGGGGGHQDAAVIGLAHRLPHCLGAVGRSEEVDLHDELEILGRHVVEGLVAQHARVVHNDVDRAEGIDGGLHDVGGRRGLGDGIVVGDGDAAGRLDLVDHLVGRGMTAPFAVDRATRIVHDHLGAAAGQQQRMRAAEPVARAGDDGDAIVEADCHFSILLKRPMKCVIPSEARDPY